MPSTYSNLKIQLMATGENNTTWGNVTNINLGTAIEEAIVGSADVTFASADVTLTLTDTNASQTARNVRLRCTGSTGGSTRNLVVPTIEKPYIVRNDCADSVVVKTAAGTGITVPAGKTMWLYVDGVNVVDVATHLSSLTLNTPLPVASGGTGANTTAGARTALGIGTMGAQNANAVAITGGVITGITDLAIADGGTGASTASGARTNLGLGALAVLDAVNNGNWSGTALAVANGGTGATDAVTARTNLGAGTVTSVSGAGTVNGLTLTGTVTGFGSLTLGGTLSNVNLASAVTGTLPVANGGTGGTTAAAARTGLGATTLGGNLFTIPNPSAITFPRFNADNTVSALDAASFLAAIGAGSGSGTVTSVSGTGTVNGLTLTGTVTSSGSLTLGGTLSNVNLATAVTGTLPVANGGTGATTVAGILSALGFTNGGNATKGYIDIPVGANTLRINWGNTSVAANTSTTDTFAAAFSTLFVGGVIGYIDTDTSHTDNVNGGATSTTTISLTNGQNVTLNLQWFAIGWA